jgi:hypothetical protein
MIIGWDMFVSERLTCNRSMLEIESLATEEVSPDNDRGGVSSPELVDECVPNLEWDTGTGQEKTGSVMTKKLVSRLHREINNLLTRSIYTIGAKTMFLYIVAWEQALLCRHHTLFAKTVRRSLDLLCRTRRLHPFLALLNNMTLLTPHDRIFSLPNACKDRQAFQE